MSKITALYERTACQDDEGILSQKKLLEAFAAEKDFQNLHHYSDCGYSAYDNYRPGFLALTKEVEEDHVGIVIIRDAARITRSAADFFHLVDDLKKHGVRIIVLQEKIDILPDHVHDDENGLDYNLHGDYYLPDLLNVALEDQRPIGKWGRMHKDYLEEHRPGLYARLMLSGELHKVLADVNQTANRRMKTITKQMMAADGVNEALKAKDQMEWIRRMNDIQHRAEETILAELIYA